MNTKFKKISPKAKKWGIVAGLAAIMLCVVFQLVSRPSPSDKNHLATAERTTQNNATKIPHKSTNEMHLELSKKIAALESTLAKVRTSDRSTSNDDAISQEDEDITFEDPELAEAEAEAQVQDQISYVEDVLHSEHVDTEWSDSAVTALYDAVQNDPSEQFTVIDADCRSTLCHVRLVLKSGLPDEGFRQLQEILPWNGESFFYMDDLESDEVAVYIAREEHSLPHLEE